MAAQGDVTQPTLFGVDPPALGSIGLSLTGPRALFPIILAQILSGGPEGRGADSPPR